MSRGCINVAIRNEDDATIASTETTRGFDRRKFFIIAATPISESATAGNSYPTAMVFSASVGLKVRIKATGKANFVKRVRLNSSTKNAQPTA